MKEADLFSLASFSRVDLELANRLLAEWGHKMGPIRRPFPVQCFALFHELQPVCVVVHAQVIAPVVGGTKGRLRREDCVELARLCAAGPQWCRVGLRLWRECVFPSLGAKFAVSYQDKGLHTGNIYRFDGWQRVASTASGPDARSGLKGRNK